MSPTRPARRILAAACLAAALAPAWSAAGSVPAGCGLYAYRAEIVRVIDGDTVVADIDLGFGTWRRGEHLRLVGLDAPEVRGDERERGLVSAEALRTRLDGGEVVVCTRRDETGKFGRYLVEIFDDAGSVNGWLLREGLARPLDAPS